MRTKALVTWLSPLAIAVLAFGSQVAFAQESSSPTREQVRAEALQAQKSGALERQRITSYSVNTNWGPGAPANTTAKPPRVLSQPAVDPSKGAASSARNPA